MDLSKLDQIEQRLDRLVTHVASVKEEHRELKRKVFALELDLHRAKADPAAAGLREKHSGLIEERDRLVMERELMRKKVSGMIERIDRALATGGGK